MTEQSLTDVFTRIADGDPLGALSGLQRLDGSAPLVGLNQELYAPTGLESGERLVEEQERMQRALPSAVGRERGMLLYNLACIELHNDDVASAQIYFSDALEVIPGFLPALHNLAYTKELMAETAEAESLYEEVLRRAPDFVLSRLNLALLRWQQGRADAADDVAALAAVHPGNASLALYRSRMLLADGSTSGAAEALDLISNVEGWEQYPDLRECHAYASFLLNELGTAEDAFRGLLAEDDGNQFARTGLIRILAGRDAWEEVAEHTRKLHAELPSEATERLTGILREMGQIQD